MFINFRPILAHRLKDINKPLLFRSGTFYHLDQSDYSILQKYNIAAYIDLRSSTEISNEPFPSKIFSDEFSIYKQPIMDTDHYLRKHADPGYEDYYNFYKYIFDNNQEEIKSILSLMLARVELGFVVGCHAGKDRTGILVMIFLKLLGFSVEDIIMDYYESTHYLIKVLGYFRPMWTKKGLTAKQYAKRLVAHKETANIFITYLEKDWIKFFPQFGCEDAKKIIGNYYHMEK